jgi:hypothetical protein
MGFEQFGLVSFVSGTRVDGFVEYLQEGKVMTTRCKRCQKVMFPPRMDCPECGGGEMEWTEIKGAGQLVTFTTVLYGPAGFEKETPYVLGLVKFPLGIKIFGPIDKKIPPEEIKVGLEMKVVPIRLSEARISYQFEKP